MDYIRLFLKAETTELQKPETSELKKEKRDLTEYLNLFQ